MKRHIYTIFFILTTLVWVACKEENEFPPEPVINSAEIQMPEKLLVIYFTDGDGNFGLGENDINPPFQPPDTITGEDNPFHNNLWVELYKKLEGEWALVETPGSFDFRIPVLTPTGQNKQIEAKITYEMAASLADLTESGDTIKFNVRLVDRDLNVSLPVETAATGIN